MEFERLPKIILASLTFLGLAYSGDLIFRKRALPEVIDDEPVVAQKKKKVKEIKRSVASKSGPVPVRNASRASVSSSAPQFSPDPMDNDDAAPASVQRSGGYQSIPVTRRSGSSYHQPGARTKQTKTDLSNTSAGKLVIGASPYVAPGSPAPDPTIGSPARSRSGRRSSNNKFTVSRFRIVEGKLLLEGENLDLIKDISISGNSVSAELKKESGNTSQLFAKSLSGLQLAVGKVYQLVIASAHASSTFDLEVTLEDGSITPEKLAPLTAAEDGYVLKWDDTAGAWIPSPDASGGGGGGGGSVTSITRGTGLVNAGTNLTTTGTIAINVGTDADQIPQFNADKKLILNNSNAIEFNETGLLIFKDVALNREYAFQLDNGIFELNNVLTSANIFRVDGNNFFVAGEKVCLEDGTNCPTASSITVSGGDGLTDSTSGSTVTLNVDTDNTTIEISGGKVALKDGAVTATKLSAMGATTAGQVLKWNGTAWAPGADVNVDSSVKAFAKNNIPFCDANETLTTIGPLFDTLSCAAIEIDPGDAGVDIGTGPLQVVQLDVLARLPAVDGSQLTNLPSAWSSATGGINYGGGRVGIGENDPESMLHINTSGDYLTLTTVGDYEGDSIDVKYTLKAINGKYGGDNVTRGGLQFRNETIYGGDPVTGVFSFDGILGIGTTNPKYTLDVAGTNAIRVPAGTTVQRPATPDNGLIRYNTDNNKLEAYVNSAWQDLSSAATGGSYLPSTGGTLSNSLTISSGGLNVNSVTSLSNTNLTIQSSGTGNVNIGNDGTGTVLTVDEGKVGIGVSDPAAMLSVHNKNESTYMAALIDVITKSAFKIRPHATDSTSLFFGGAAGGAQLIQSSNGAGTTAYPITLNPFGGSVGIGTLAPSFELDIFDGASDAKLRLKGVGSVNEFSGIQLGSDEATDKTWLMSHRRDILNTLKFSFHDGTTWRDQFTLRADTGYAGFRTNNPSTFLHLNVGNVSAETPVIRFQGSDGIIGADISNYWIGFTDDTAGAFSRMAFSAVEGSLGGGGYIFKNLSASGNIIFDHEGKIGAGGEPSYSLDLQKTDAMRIPAGTTAQRPTAGAGVVRYNTDNKHLEYNDGTNWVTAAGPSKINTIANGFAAWPYVIPAAHDGETTINRATFCVIHLPATAGLRAGWTHHIENRLNNFQMFQHQCFVHASAGTTFNEQVNGTQIKVGPRSRMTVVWNGTTWVSEGSRGAFISFSPGNISIIEAAQPITGNGVTLSLRGSLPSEEGSGGAVNITGANATSISGTGNFDGGSVIINAGMGKGLGSGGHLNMSSGSSSFGNAGHVFLRAANATSADLNAGSLEISGGTNHSTSGLGNGGNVLLRGGNGPRGGSVTIAAGNSTDYYGADTTIAAGNGTIEAGQLILRTGTSSTSVAGPVRVIAGNGDGNISLEGKVKIGVSSMAAYPLDVVGDIHSNTRLLVSDVQVCTSTGCTAVSDKSLKTNINPLVSSLEKILKLQGVEYDWKDKKKFGHEHQVGFIAQDLEKVYPEVVKKDKKTGLRSVSYGNLIAPVIEAIKELHQLIVSLFDKTEKHGREIASLKKENAELREAVCEINPKAKVCTRAVK